MPGWLPKADSCLSAKLALAQRNEHAGTPSSSAVVLMRVVIVPAPSMHAISARLTDRHRTANETPTAGTGIDRRPAERPALRLLVRPRPRPRLSRPARNRASGHADDELSVVYLTI